MGFLSELGRFFSEVTSGPESRVNKLSSAVVNACKREITKEQQLEILKAIAGEQWTVQARFDLLQMRLKSSRQEISTNELICNYVVAIGDTILALLGEDPGNRTHRSEKDNERMCRSCQLQRDKVYMAKVNQETLRDALWQSFGIKALWKVFGDQRWEQCNITGLELWARDEWNKTHPMPGN